ncbi:hypothetical protein AMTRI_Chr07g23630 [Amborella trichopoda]|uniref:Senescence regulator n=1 Tax=Amborella trichopoda TaxID=13333 RepID=W1PMG2_AMBTC|nr:uncharacterized protein LOC18995772 [Amborella trichopoda]ERN08355.1 hypothetical protein AMTR_s00148p00028850 [Amborella trichopoda]|eukprot:XP_011624263.1 uncharacterized protein LOC18995772 [Amborella trichopoda]
MSYGSRLLASPVEFAADCGDMLGDLSEEDIWNSRRASERIVIPAARAPRRPAGSLPGCGERRSAAASFSAPVNIPDWSKILREEFRDRHLERESDEEREYEEREGEMVPPHLLIARQFARANIVSFSVHEGAGRTLKGRDLSRVRNAIWKKTGFQD